MHSNNDKYIKLKKVITGSPLNGCVNKRYKTNPEDEEICILESKTIVKSSDIFDSNYDCGNCQTLRS